MSPFFATMTAQLSVKILQLGSRHHLHACRKNILPVDGRARGIFTETGMDNLSLSSPCCCPLLPVADISLLVVKSNGFLLEMVLVSSFPSSPAHKPPKYKPPPTQPNWSMSLDPALLFQCQSITAQRNFRSRRHLKLPIQHCLLSLRHQQLCC